MLYRRLSLALVLLVLLPAILEAQATVTVIDGLSGPALAQPEDLAIDVWANGSPLANHLDFAQVKGPISLAAGLYHLQVYPAGANPAATAALADTTTTLADGDDVHVVTYLVPVPSVASPRVALTLFFNDNTPRITGSHSRLLPARASRLVFRHTAAYPRLALNNATLPFDPTLASEDTVSLNINPGVYAFALSQAGTPRPVLLGRPMDFALVSGTTRYVYFIGSPVDASFRFLTFTAPLP